MVFVRQASRELELGSPDVAPLFRSLDWDVLRAARAKVDAKAEDFGQAAKAVGAGAFPSSARRATTGLACGAGARSRSPKKWAGGGKWGKSSWRSDGSNWGQDNWKFPADKDKSWASSRGARRLPLLWLVQRHVLQAPGIRPKGSSD